MDTPKSFQQKYFFRKINPNKLSFIFTWDDNFEAHFTWIAPIFEFYLQRCTFFVNPGEPDYQEFLWEKYALLAKKGFDIGSHGYTHHYFSSLPDTTYAYQLIKSKKAIEETIGVIPIIFAFPHHDFTAQMLKEAKEIYFETRNTLYNTPRFSFKSDTTLFSIQKVIDTAITNGNSLVFSGHSVSLDMEIQRYDGYQPIKLKLLEDTLEIILKHADVSEICTFSQAALKEYIRSNCVYTDTFFFIDNNQLVYLEQFGLTSKRIEELI